jgi:L-fuculose-phosphate aldolase
MRPAVAGRELVKGARPCDPPSPAAGSTRAAMRPAVAGRGLVKGARPCADRQVMARQLRDPSEDLGDLRAAVVQTSRLVARAGLVVGTAGNVSARRGGLVAITPTGSRLASLSADEIAIVDLDGRLVDGPLAPTSELPLHLAVYHAYDAGAVVHTHPPMGTAVACVAGELPLFHYTLLTLGGSVRVARYATFGTDDLAESVTEALEGRTAALLGGHGAVTYGDDLQAALDATELLEWACDVYVHACAIGTPRVLAEDERVAVAAALAGYGSQRTIHAGSG